MVKMVKTKIMRPAIAMLELIFAIVIMGIILMSAPQLISTSTKSGFVAVQQEAINEAASQVNMIMGYHWDENSADETVLDPILQTASPVTDLAESTYLDGNGTGRRIGTPEESYRSFLRPDGSRLSATLAGDLGSDGTETPEDDIDDFTGVKNLIEIDPSVADTVETTTINIARAVSYNTDTVTGGYNQSNIAFVPFNAAPGTTSIKEITVTVTSSSGVEELEKNIILHAFSCNIGGYKLEEREF